MDGGGWRGSAKERQTQCGETGYEGRYRWNIEVNREALVVGYVTRQRTNGFDTMIFDTMIFDTMIFDTMISVDANGILQIIYGAAGRRHRAFQVLAVSMSVKARWRSPSHAPRNPIQEWQ